MAIINDIQLTQAVTQATRLMQDIQAYCGKTLRDDSKFAFPWGVIGTAEQYRQICPGYLDERQQSSCAYGFMHLDVVWWYWRAPV